MFLCCISIDMRHLPRRNIYSLIHVKSLYLQLPFVGFFRVPKLHRQADLWQRILSVVQELRVLLLHGSYLFVFYVDEITKNSFIPVRSTKLRSFVIVVSIILRSSPSNPEINMLKWSKNMVFVSRASAIYSMRL